MAQPRSWPAALLEMFPALKDRISRSGPDPKPRVGQTWAMVYSGVVEGVFTITEYEAQAERPRQPVGPAYRAGGNWMSGEELHDLLFMAPRRAYLLSDQVCPAEAPWAPEADPSESDPK